MIDQEALSLLAWTAVLASAGAATLACYWLAQRLVLLVLGVLLRLGVIE